MPRAGSTKDKRLCACGCGKNVSGRTEYRHLHRNLPSQLTRLSKWQRKQRLNPTMHAHRVRSVATQRKEQQMLNVSANDEHRSNSPDNVDLSFDTNDRAPEIPVGFDTLDDVGSQTPQQHNTRPTIDEMQALGDTSVTPSVTQLRHSDRLAEMFQQRWGHAALLDLPREDGNNSETEVDNVPLEPHEGGVDESDDDTETISRGLQALNLISENFDKEYASIQNDHLEESDISLLRAYTLKIEEGLTNQTYEKLRHAFPGASLGTLKETESRVKFLSGVMPTRYDCCPLSCICYTGPYEQLQHCPTCKGSRLDSNGRPRLYFEYYPITPRLRAMATNHKTATTMRYRSNYENDPGMIGDVFDGSHYKSLRQTCVTIGGETFPRFYFADPRDVALGISTDGFGPFKQRNKTSWPIILFNYNLPPEERFLRRNIIAVGVIPGPKKPTDMDSFFWPMVNELIELAEGVGAFDALTKSAFELHAYPILGFGDIPAISMVMRIKGQNSLVPCRGCEIPGIRGPDGPTLYVPLHRKNFPGSPPSYDPKALPLRTHDGFLAQAEQIEAATTTAECEHLQKKYGIKGVPLLSALNSLSFPLSFPYDFMHLFWANLLPNLILLWTASYKDIDHRSQPYVINKTVWEAIGAAGAAAGKTIPAAFGCRVPDLSNEKAYMTCESYSIWTLYLAPALLRGRFTDERYYKHFVELVGLINLCLKYNLSSNEVDQLEDGFAKWVTDYERLYYQHRPERVSCCPLTVHALLHIAPSIRALGPVWAYWAFPMERFCNELLPHIGSRKHPYKSINKYLGARAQISQIKLLYNLDSTLALLPVPSYDHKFRDDAYSGWALSYPSLINVALPQSLCKKLIATLVTTYNRSYTEIRRLLPRNNTLRVSLYGRARQTNDSDTIHAREMIVDKPDSRDMTFVRYDLLVDIHARHTQREPEFQLQTFFGQAKWFFVMEMPESLQWNIQRTTLIFAAIRQVVISESLPQPNTLSYYENADGPLDIVDIKDICGVVGRIPLGNKWVIIDRQDIVPRLH